MKQPEKSRKKTARYQIVKDFILDRIHSGALQAGMKVESEAELVAALNVSRMTVNRAIRELTAMGLLERIQGKGTFVLHKKPQAPLFEIQPIDQIIQSRGGNHSCNIHLLNKEKAKPALASKMELAPYSTVFHAIIQHNENDIPIQLADRYINPKIAPNLLDQDFTKSTISEYLIAQSPFTAVEHVVEAMLPDPWVCDLLKINDSEPCLVLYRRTWVEETIATYSTFYHPGSRYTLQGSFKPAAPGGITVT
ncbi:histidine utilization repressor [Desulforhopalus singaporensis]|uniref:Histidine utilization repressor n=1 Tax=Desulforhopalus singaporensis TaxID=91360 RepID=A0A1H0RNK2_9BACT|nr:histidine utilization repressor [Desulforhopalus singaporensis]SDP30959.1 GntR family transcriptional regulator, histidine utilization repressor [Desulforhopalus singaporensis]